MKNNINKLLIFALLFFSAVYLTSTYNSKRECKAIEKRALDYEMKECYTWQDIEIIIFGEIQE